MASKCHHNADLDGIAVPGARLVPDNFLELIEATEVPCPRSLQSEDDSQILRRAREALTSAEYLESPTAVCLEEQGARLLIEERIDDDTQRIAEGLCVDCVFNTCSSATSWTSAFHGVLNRDLPVEQRTAFVRVLRCKRRVNDDVIERLISCLDFAEDSRIQLSALIVLGHLGRCASSVVPTAIEILTSLDISHETQAVDNLLYRESLFAIASCLTDGMDEALDLLFEHLDFRRFGESTSSFVAYSLCRTRSMKQRIVDTLVEIIDSSDMPDSVRESAVSSVGHFPHYCERHVTLLCNLMCEHHTPMPIRVLLCRYLHRAARPQNIVADTYRQLAEDARAPQSLRLQALWSFRKMDVELRSQVIGPALEFLRAPQSPEIGKIAFILTAATLHSAGPLLSDPEEDAFLRLAIPAMFQSQHATGNHTDFSSSMRPDYVALAMNSRWLERELRQIIGARRHSVLDDDAGDLLQSLFVYLLELFVEPNALVAPTTGSVRVFHRHVVDRINCRARHRLPKYHRAKYGERHGKIRVVQFEEAVDFADNYAAPIEGASNSEIEQLMIALLKSELTDLERECVWALRVDELSLDSAAERLGISRDMVRRTAIRATAKLQKRLSRLVS